jgi:hypothetical protein
MGDVNALARRTAPSHLPGLGRREPGEQPQQARLATPVGPAQPHHLPRLHLELQALEENTVAAAAGQVGDGKRGQGVSDQHGMGDLFGNSDSPALSVTDVPWPTLREHPMNKDLLGAAGAITAALITNPSPGVSRSKLSDVGTLFANVYLELEKSQAIVDKLRAQGATPAP